MLKALRVLVRLSGLLGLALWLTLRLLDKRRTGPEALHPLCPAILRCLGITLKLEGVKPQGSAALFLANHLSYIDILAISAIQPTRFLAKSEIAGWPVFGALARRMDTIFVERASIASGARAIRSLRAGMRRGREAVCLFPEGTTTAGVSPKLDLWKSGHGHLLRLDTGAGVYALGLKFENIRQAAWIDDQSLVPHILRLCAAPGQTLTIHFAEIPRADKAARSLALESHARVTALCLKKI